MRALFIEINRGLAPEQQKADFEAYISRSLQDEIDRITDYYAERDGGFWVAEEDGEILGMYGIERIDPDVAELRRMYVSPRMRRRGIARALLGHAESWCRLEGYRRLALSTSELQESALALYRSSGYRLLREEIASGMTNKVVGSGLRRFYMEKLLPADTQASTDTVVS